MNSGSEVHAQIPSSLPQAATRRQLVPLTGVTVLAAILVVATGLRILSALFQGNGVTALPGIFDQISYDGLAQRVVDGYGFSFGEAHWPATRAGEPTAHWSYLYTLYLAGIYSLFGLQPVVARLLQAVIAGVLHPWLTLRLGRRVFGPRVGLVAAGLSAIYSYFVYYAGGLLTETFYFIAILWTLDCAMRITEQDRGWRWSQWLELGLAVGVTVLLRQVFVLFVPFLFLWIWWNLPVERGRVETRVSLGGMTRWPALKGLLVTGFVLVALIVPWTLRNYRAFGTVVPLNTNAGFAFYWGNHPIHGTRAMPLLPADGPAYIDLIPPDLLPLNEGQLDQALLREALHIVSSDPVRYVRLSESRTREYFKFWPSPDSGLASNIARVGSFGLLLPFMVYGLWRSVNMLRRPEHPAQRSQLFLLYSFMAVYTTLHLLTWTLIRYRLPVDTILVLFAAVGVIGIADHLPWRVIPRAKPASTP